jgi:NAD(P)-dependent dehydrogenase (short-subunit alcohol dehydrogenase family)
MRILVVGGTGTIGSPLVSLLSSRHEIVTAGRQRGDHAFDYTRSDEVQRLYDAVGPLDAVVCCAGGARFKPLGDLADEDYAFSLRHKLMGQVNLVRHGHGRLRDGGSFTLTSGVLGLDPLPGSAAISLVNMALEGFARAAALELPRAQRINVVSPPWVTETLAELGWTHLAGLPARDVARAYVASVEGKQTGQVLDARDFA